jgi:hypothetical protein
MALACLTGSCGDAGSSEHAALVKFCQSDGAKAAICTCAADKIEGLLEQKAISSEMFRALVLEAQGKPEDSDAILADMTIDEKFTQVTAIGEARASCDETASS